jgi:hypothetical protein
VTGESRGGSRRGGYFSFAGELHSGFFGPPVQPMEAAFTSLSNPRR